jgi:VIT1/CCC1 family predicted Fe2+/Mn2+ transporter
MAQSRNSGRRGSDRSVVTALWIIAGGSFVIGCLLRIMASLLTGYHLRITGVGLIAFGLALAVLGWAGERAVSRRTSS